ncbi:MAG: tol-pal system-associated acyl-CoA thioesterase [Hydrogenophaga sp.]
MGEPGNGFVWPVRVYWEDTDAGGIVFYANYLKFFERARTEWLRELGIEQQRLRDTLNGMFVVTDTQLKYRQPARLDDFLLVTARLTEAGRASLTIAQSAYRCAAGTHTAANVPRDPHAQGNTLLCEGSIRIGWVDAGTLRPHRIPDTILQALKRP